MVRSTSSTASGSSVTMMRRRLHRRAEGRELADAQHLARLDRLQRQLDRGGEGERAFRAHQQARQIVAAGGARGRRQRCRCCSRRRGEAGAGKRAAISSASAAPSSRSRWIRSAMRAGTSAPRLSGSGAEAMPRAVGQDRIDRAARCPPSGRSGWTSSRRNCCRPCRRWCSAHGSTDRPGRTGRAAADLRVQVAQHDARLDQRVRSPDPTAAPDAGTWSSRSPAPGSPSGRTGWCRRRAAAPARRPPARSPMPRRRRSIRRGTITPIGSTW